LKFQYVLTDRLDTCSAPRFPAEGFSNGWLFMKETTHRRTYNLVRKKLFAIGARSMAPTPGAYKDAHAGSIIQELGLCSIYRSLMSVSIIILSFIEYPKPLFSLNL
jgi:hypothetical protein